VESNRRLAASRAGIADALHDFLKRGKAGLWGGAEEGAPPSVLACPVPGVGIGAIDAMAVVWTFRDRDCDIWDERAGMGGAYDRTVWPRRPVRSCGAILPIVLFALTFSE